MNQEEWVQNIEELRKKLSRASSMIAKRERLAESIYGLKEAIDAVKDFKKVGISLTVNDSLTFVERLSDVSILSQLLSKAEKDAELLDLQIKEFLL
jgi:hypothetical protein